MDDSAQTVECDTCGDRVPTLTVVDDYYRTWDDAHPCGTRWYCQVCHLADLEGSGEDEQRRSAHLAACAAAENPRTLPDVLAAMARTGNPGVRRAVAENPSTPPEVLARLADDNDRDVCRHVAGNPSTPPEVLGRLADAEDWWVPSHVASNPSTPPEVLTALASSDEVAVLSALAANPAVPTEVRMAAQLRSGRDTGGR